MYNNKIVLRIFTVVALAALIGASSPWSVIRTALARPTYTEITLYLPANNDLSNSPTEDNGTCSSDHWTGTWDVDCNLTDPALKFDWSPNDDTTTGDYTIEIATDTQFTNIAYTETLSDTATTIPFYGSDQPLSLQTNYYWRVSTPIATGTYYSATHRFGTWSPGRDFPALTPAEEETGVSTTPHFTWEADPYEDNKYGFSISTNDNPNDTANAVYSANTISTELDLPITLQSNTDYYWRVITDPEEESYAGHHNYTGVMHFKTAATTEDGAPNNGDANNDGIADSSQDSVTSILDSVTNAYAVLETTGTTGHTVVEVKSESSNSQTDPDYSYPAGLLHFTATLSEAGSTITVTQYFYGVDQATYVLRKYNSITNVYSTVSGATLSTVTVGGKTAIKAVYQVTDGSSLDEDGLVNGSITDPVGLGLVVLPVTGRNSLLTQVMTDYLK